MKNIKRLVKNESFPGFLLIACTLFALVCQNTIFSAIYEDFLYVKVSFSVNDFTISKTLLHWINDGLIAVFFLCIGLELKYEILRGQLRHIKAVSLPIFGALGGMIVPALIFWAINYNDAFAMKGWAIPTATDIAFAVGILMLLGNKVPASLKLFLLSLAIFDDLGAIVIIALFYTSELSSLAIFVCMACVLALFILNYLRVSKLPFYFIVGVILWIAMLESGVHATLSGVIVALFIPIERKNGEPFLKHLYHDLDPWVIFFILPLFAFANAGIDLRDMEFSALLSPVSLGIFLGLFAGKQIGVFLFSFISIKLKIATLPQNVGYTQFYGICILAGIGFTMSLFIDGLAYAENVNAFEHADRLAILLASFVSALVAYIYLKCIKTEKKDKLASA
ncbi:Na+/H+ antiporter NhaA [Campylobacter sp. MIT 12-8780]|uniref:Na+/H+ antiporter NhaA n=1 Tax=unclassified Campylobacter TaxID=2593542 RepID=UPI00115D35FB|nr:MULTISPECIES: Na+/H+ antiporter NhaA [unclassified Campylobacter]NDJ27234.1 Na+/H+ antiporter NhaA [Campylobacter sp. MIT 19-121]TQR41474.1 Na+/H+ antiporter NhaA [Campylobacter sp. MIT 12-8780]